MEKDKDNLLSKIFNITKSSYNDNLLISNIVKKISKDIDNKVQDNYKNTGTYNGKELYEIDNSKLNLNIGSIITTASNNSISYRDNEIDILVANMPILGTAIELKKDNILPGDSVSDDYLNITQNSNIVEEETFKNNIEYIKHKYNICDIFDSTFFDTCKYGEVFHHIISFKDNIDPLIKSFNNFKKDHHLNENNTFNKTNSININKIEVNFYENLIPEEISSINLLNEFNNKFHSNLSESNKLEKRGAIVRTLKRENVIPIYINDTCLGYYYIDVEDVKDIKSQNGNRSFYNSNFNNSNNITLDLATKIAYNINSKFINTNHLYTNDIYNILKYIDNIHNSKINVCYISPNNMIHWTFKKNKNNRGISDLEKAIVPAKAYLLLSNSYKYAIITRSHDKRAYYIKQSKADSDTSQLINKAIDEIHRTNNGLNFFNNMSSIAGFSGLFNDIVIPVNDSGEAAIQFDTISGQNINVDMDFLTEQEKQAIESMEMPYDYVKSSNEIDFATRLNHQHGKFLKHCVKRQSILEPLMSKFINLIYLYEYGEDVNIRVKLTPPVTFKNNIITNIIDNYNSLASTLSDIYVEVDPQDQHSENKFKIWRKNFIQSNISSYISELNIEDVMKKTEIEYSKYKALYKDEEE